MSKEYCVIPTKDGKSWIVHGGKLGDVVCYDPASAEMIVCALNDQVTARSKTTLRRAEAARESLDKLIKALEDEICP